MFIFGFEETKYIHVETLEGRQASIISGRQGSVNAIDISGTLHGDNKNEKSESFSAKQSEPESPVAEPEEQVSEREAARRLSVIHVDPHIRRKPYWQRLALTTTSPGHWSDFLRHSWQPFAILVRIPGVLFCSLVYAVLLAWQTVQVRPKNRSFTFFLRRRVAFDKDMLTILPICSSDRDA